ncbi:hypothetical protein FLAVO9R_100038 [Flavobacterium sp. 9R]|nr:hypothetical protein FLAVO9R_100038 [Flavobacterium sp. 9R]
MLQSYTFQSDKSYLFVNLLFSEYYGFHWLKGRGCPCFLTTFVAYI